MGYYNPLHYYNINPLIQQAETNQVQVHLVPVHSDGVDDMGHLHVQQAILVLQSNFASCEKWSGW